MRDRHWDQLSAQLGFRLHPDKNFTLAAAESMGLLSHLEVITKVADVAGKEYAIEQVGSYTRKDRLQAALRCTACERTGGVAPRHRARWAVDMSLAGNLQPC